MTTENSTAVDGLGISRVPASTPLSDDEARELGLGTTSVDADGNETARHWFAVQCDAGHDHYIGDDPALGTTFECHTGAKVVIEPAVEA